MAFIEQETLLSLVPINGALKKLFVGRAGDAYFCSPPDGPALSKIYDSEIATVTTATAIDGALLSTGSGPKTIYIRGYIPSLGMNGIDPDQRSKTIEGLQKIAGPDIKFVRLE